MTELFTKKLEYLVNSLLQKHIVDNYPKYVDFIKVWLRFIDENYATKILSIQDNTDADTVYSELLDLYLNQYFKDVIDLTKFELTDQNKRIYLTLSKFINNLKGNKKSIDFLFRLLSNFRIADEAGNVDIGKVDVLFEENEDWWLTGDTHYHDGTYIYDGTIDHTANLPRPFTYRFTLSEEREAIINLIESIHPAGFEREFLTVWTDSDDQSTTDLLSIILTVYNYYNQDNSEILHNGVRVHNASQNFTVGD